MQSSRYFRNHVIAALRPYPSRGRVAQEQTTSDGEGAHKLPTEPAKPIDYDSWYPEVPSVMNATQLADLLDTSNQVIRTWTRNKIVPAHRGSGKRKFWYLRHEIFDWLIATLRAIRTCRKSTLTGGAHGSMVSCDPVSLPRPGSTADTPRSRALQGNPQLARRKGRNRWLTPGSNIASPSIIAVASVQQPTIVSVGYQQRTLDELISLLWDNAVDVLVDVRLNPISRKPGFSKSSLAEGLDKVGIEYRHERELGNPKDNRDAFRRGLRSARSRYSRHLQNGAADVYQDVIHLVHTARLALLCVEREPQECHRSSILEAARDDIPDLRVIDV